MDDRKRIERKLQSSVHALVILHEAARVLGSTLELEEIGARLLEIMRRVSDRSTAVLELQDEMGGLRTLCALGPEDVRHWASTNPEVQAARRDALEAKEYRLFRLTQPERNVTASVVLYLPLVVRDRVTGVLGVYGPAALAEKTTLNALVSLTAQAASALENARLHRELVERERRLRDLV